MNIFTLAPKGPPFFWSARNAIACNQNSSHVCLRLRERERERDRVTSEDTSRQLDKILNSS